MARIKKGWSQKDKARSLEDIGSAISFNIWQISGQGVLDLENEGFQTDTASQRLDVITEYVAYLVQLVDRFLFEGFDLDRRKGLITSTGLHLASIMQDNRQDTEATSSISLGRKCMTILLVFCLACWIPLNEKYPRLTADEVKI